MACSPVACVTAVRQYVNTSTRMTRLTYLVPDELAHVASFLSLYEQIAFFNTCKHTTCIKDTIIANRKQCRTAKLLVCKNTLNTLIDTTLTESFVTWLIELTMLTKKSVSRCLVECTLCEAMAAQGNLSLLQWAYEKGYYWEQSNYFCFIAAKRGHLEIIQWVLTTGCTWNSDFCVNAAANGHIDIVKWGYENRFNCNSSRCSHYAAAYGHVEVLEWLIDNGCEYDSRVCAFSAAQSGNVEVLKCLFKHGTIAWDESLCATAAARGDLELIKWARKHGCPWDSMTLKIAARYNHRNVLEWAAENGCPSWS